MIKVGLIIDQNLVRLGIKYIISEYPDIQVRYDCNTPENFKQNIHSDIDIIIYCFCLISPTDLSHLQVIRNTYPKTPILTIYLTKREPKFENHLRLIADRYMTQCNSGTELYNEIIALTKVKTTADCQLKHANLSFREHEMLIRLANGETLTQIAEDTQLSIKTISTYRRRILEKLDLQNNSDLIKYCLHHKLI